MGCGATAPLDYDYFQSEYPSNPPINLTQRVNKSNVGVSLLTKENLANYALNRISQSGLPRYRQSASSSVSSNCSNSQSDFNVQDVEHDAILMELESQSADIGTSYAVAEQLEKIKTVTPYGEYLCKAFKDVVNIVDEPTTIRDIEILGNTVIAEENNPTLFYLIKTLTHQYEIDLEGGDYPSITLSLKSDSVFVASLKAFEKQKLNAIAIINYQLTPGLVDALGQFFEYTRPNIIFLESCGLNAKRIETLSRSLGKLNSLRHLELSNNPLTDYGIVVLLKNLITTKQLRYLGLKQTQARNGAIRELCDEVDKLERADFSDNPGISRESYQIILDTVHHNIYMKYFTLDNCGLNPHLVDSIARLAQRNLIAESVFLEMVSDAVERVEHPYPPQYVAHLKTEQKLLKHNELDAKLDPMYFFSEKLRQELIYNLIDGDYKYYPKQKKVQLQIASSETMGRRQEMEDVQCIIPDFLTFRLRKGGLERNDSYVKETLLCLFDGHGGRDCSEKLSRVFPNCLADVVNEVMIATEFQSTLYIPLKTWETLFTSCFLLIDREMRKMKIEAGSTAAIVYIIDTLIITANCGDSRVVLSRDQYLARQKGLIATEYTVKRKAKANNYGDAISEVAVPLFKPQQKTNLDEEISNRSYANIDCNVTRDDLSLRLSKDHKPYHEDEKYRIEKAGGYVQNARLLGIVSVARSFGDYVYKPVMSVIPFVSTYLLGPRDQWIIIACDGIWDVLDDYDAAVLVLGCQNAYSASLKLRDEAYKFDSGDNISVICCKFIREGK